MIPAYNYNCMNCITPMFLCKTDVNKTHGFCGSCSFIWKSKSIKFCSHTFYIVINKNRICRDNAASMLNHWKESVHVGTIFHTLPLYWTGFGFIYTKHRSTVLLFPMFYCSYCEFTKTLTTPPWWWQPVTYTRFPVFLFQWRPPPSASGRKMAQARRLLCTFKLERQLNNCQCKIMTCQA